MIEYSAVLDELSSKNFHDEYLIEAYKNADNTIEAFNISIEFCEECELSFDAKCFVVACFESFVKGFVIR